MGDVQLADLWRQLEGYARRVRERAPSGNRRALLAHLHQVLFEEEGFAGNQQQYYTAENSYLPEVLATRQGIPISLTLVYKAVAELAGLQVVGLNSPGHFLAAVNDGEGEIIVDPFFGGQKVTR